MSRGASALDAEIDALYASAPDAFTKNRDALAKRLKTDGDAEAAAAVKALRRPTQVAYVLNSVARRFADEVGELVDVGRELARAQRKALRGGDATGELRAAIARQRDVVRDLTTKTGALMGELGVSPSGHLDEIAGALQAALVDPVVGAALEEGRLEKVPAPAAGFPGAAPDLAMVPPPPPSRTRPAKAKAKAKTKTKANARAREEAKAAKLDAKHRAALERARSAADKAKAHADLLGGRAVEARRAADALRAEAERLAAEADELAKHARARAKEAKAASKEAAAAGTKAKKSERDADRAERQASRLATKARAR